jgi:hypothetical protein
MFLCEYYARDLISDVADFQGANLLFPFAWEELLSLLDPSERTIIIPAFYKRLTSDDESVRAQAVCALLIYYIFILPSSMM